MELPITGVMRSTNGHGFSFRNADGGTVFFEFESSEEAERARELIEEVVIESKSTPSTGAKGPLPSAGIRWLVTVAFSATAVPALADNSKCWGIGSDDAARPEITCTALTERLLLSLRGASRAEVVKAMNASGRDVEIGLHYLSNANTYSGDVNFTFEADHVAVISAMVTPTNGSTKDLEFIWNAKLSSCSGFPGSRKRCNE